MNTTETVARTANYEADLKARNEKHRKASRNFPSIEDIDENDRFSVPQGASAYSKTLAATIVLHEGIKVEVKSINKNENGNDENANERSFNVVKLTRMGDGQWAPDNKFGTLQVEYTDLRNWHNKS